ncbi:Inorganic phosphate transporter [Hyphodiscus hymeniophilus]|uniref:Inorganic phosphate transporter n=1 Tax=Hyphodiscus hymeniophilus TaxID=353542 RepID=A0A9P6VI76_9HELO|nr:Inorganic phosphate transporter [Hyphodiscus hymeniophilus]
MGRFIPRIWINPSDVAAHHETNTNKRDQICGDIDANGFDWQIWAVAGSGFFTDSYNLFATNVILPSLAFVYWTNDTNSDHETDINAVTLSGSLLGQLIFGFLADRFGRRKLYGLELIVVIFGTLGWIMFWRFFVGLGIGAEYPLSAVITAEFAPRRSRARMMAAVFLMQPLGQLLSSIVGLAVLLTVGRNAGLATETDPESAKVIVDRIWRYVVGIGAIPALVAIVFRLTIPESPRFTLDVDHDGARALRDTQKYYNIRRTSTNGSSNRHYAVYTDDIEDDAGMQQIPRAAINNETNPHSQNLDQETHETAANHESFSDDDDDSMQIQELAEAESQDQEGDKKAGLPDPFSVAELRRFFWTEGNLKYLLGTSVTWFLLDLAFYGLGINNPRVIAQIWSSKPVNVTAANHVPDWQNPSDPNETIYEVLKQDGVRSIITISVGSMLGSIIFIKMINYVPRKAWLYWSFIGLAVLFAVVGGTYFKAANSNLHALTIVLYVLCQLLFNLGPNTLTFIIPAEIFPTRYRGTCHGISAAAGKLGSIVVQAFLPQTRITNPNSKSLGWVLIAFSFTMALSAVFTWAWIPELQDARGTEPQTRRGGKNRFRDYEVPSKSLEELSFGRAGVTDERRMVGFRRRGALLMSDIRSIKRSNTDK